MLLQPIFSLERSKFLILDLLGNKLVICSSSACQQAVAAYGSDSAVILQSVVPIGYVRPL